MKWFNRRYIKREQWKHDCDALITAWMYGNPPGGWSDPTRRENFTRTIGDIQSRLNEYDYKGLKDS
jgi:hypothetical protein